MKKNNLLYVTLGSLLISSVVCAQSEDINDRNDRNVQSIDTAELEKKSLELLRQEEDLLKQAESSVAVERNTPTSAISAENKDLETFDISDNKTAANDSKVTLSIDEDVVDQAALAASALMNNQPKTRKVLNTNSKSDSTIDEIIQSKEQSFETVDSKGSADVFKEIERLRSENSNLKSSLQDKSRSIRSIGSEKYSCENNLSTLRRELKKSLDELKESKSRLMLAETEVNRLSSIVNPNVKVAYTNKASEQPKASLKSDKLQSNNLQASSELNQIKESQRVVPEKSSDMPIATVVSDKAFLRTGPGKDNSPLMSVRKGTRLAIETRNGEWFRVISPTGTRAWIAAEVLAFGQDYKSGPTRTVKIKAYDNKIDEAFNLINSK